MKRYSLYVVGVLLVGGIIYFSLSRNEETSKTGNEQQTKHEIQKNVQHKTSTAQSHTATSTSTSKEGSNVRHLDAEGFRENIFDYKNNKKWSYKGELPALIEFYAEWCGPCKQIAPVLDKLSLQYEDEVVIYKVNVEKEKELASIFRVRSIPTFVFIDDSGQKPQTMKGALSESSLKNKIQNQLLDE